ncbi:hypothetical protein HNQ77_000545 [Silvibacterium bohemicum]|uniref:Uncharacterized protein n=1 Tax=Silvibacterium bohemicum TaxID=1577686 RepID=A0A841JPW3_9BACT|nr:hypothetical protein [Silvibacterium bohemicum]
MFKTRRSMLRLRIERNRRMEYTSVRRRPYKAFVLLSAICARGYQKSAAGLDFNAAVARGVHGGMKGSWVESRSELDSSPLQNSRKQ